uniref:Reverse transcriptase n=1 Tax=Peronospora matthiolae TaxID=2874970 RepID=A0AAV1UZ22_9STRA
MREHKLLANLKKCIFAANEIPLLGCIVGKNGVRPDPEKIKAISNWPFPVDGKGLRKFLGLSAYLHKYSHNFA